MCFLCRVSNKHLFSRSLRLIFLFPFPLAAGCAGKIRESVGGQRKTDDIYGGKCLRGLLYPEPVFLNVYEAQESIPRNEFRQPM
jgi:hypothetical protein